MHVYIIRHACPVNTTEVDPVLSQKGIAQARMLGRLFAAVQLQPDAVKIMSSRMQRARQTATHLCQETGVPDDVFIFPTPQEEHSGIDLKNLLMRHLQRIVVEEARSEIIVIGHYPNMSQSLAWLAGQNGWSLPKSYGATACLSCESSFDEGSGSLEWLVTPDLPLGMQFAPDTQAPSEGE